jgi:DNA-binding PadR family transcriptional regulator
LVSKDRSTYTKYFRITKTHASKLEEAGYINIIKSFRGKKPVTILEITEKGRDAFKEYKNRMQELLSG